MRALLLNLLLAGTSSPSKFLRTCGIMHKAHAIEIFNAATDAVQPARLLQAHLAVTNDALIICGQAFSKDSFGHLYVIGAGKAAAAMAVETENILGHSITDGVVTTKYEHALPTQRIRVIEAAHPVPDAASIAAVQQTLEMLQKATSDDLVICLLSGGASALWCDVPPQLSLTEIQETFKQLIHSGAGIEEVNVVRKHLSLIKGGQLVRHCGGAQVVSLIISDVPGDSLDVIASGPTVPDASSFSDVQKILTKYGLHSRLPSAVHLYIEKGLNGMVPETPKKNDPIFSQTLNFIIGNNKVALLAAAQKAKILGYHIHLISELVTGNTVQEAVTFTAIAQNYTGPKPVCILQGGETTIQVTGTGKGGRNQHFTLVALVELNKLQHRNQHESITILSGGTDGTDGPTDAAGGVVDHNTWAQAANRQLSVEDYMKHNDAYHFLQQTDSLLVTGPTQTNVMDIMIAIVQ